MAWTAPSLIYYFLLTLLLNWNLQGFRKKTLTKSSEVNLNWSCWCFGLLSMCWFSGTRRVRANQVYQEYISDRHHTHMNSTQVSIICSLTTDKLQDCPSNYLCHKGEFDFSSRFTGALFYCTHLMVYSRREHWLLIMAYIYYCSCTVGNSNWLCEVARKRR